MSCSPCPCTPPPVPATWDVSSRWLPQSALPRALWVPAWSGVLKPQRWWSCLAGEMLLRCAGGNSAVFPGQPAATNQRLSGGGLMLSVDVPGVSLQLWWIVFAGAGANGWGYALRNCFEHLVVEPVIAAINQDLCELFTGLLATESFRVESNSFPKLLTGCSVIDGIVVPEIENQGYKHIHTFFRVCLCNDAWQLEISVRCWAWYDSLYKTIQFFYLCLA